MNKVLSILLLASAILFANNAFSRTPFSNDGCVSIQETEPNPGTRYELQNNCSFGVVLFYCKVDKLREIDPDCRKGEQYAAVTKKVRDFQTEGPGPKSLKQAREENKEQLQFFQNKINECQMPMCKLDQDVYDVVSILKKSEYSLYTLLPGDSYDASSASDRDNNKNIILISYCPILEYTTGKCAPSALSYWKELGRPSTPADTDRAQKNYKNKR